MEIMPEVCSEFAAAIVKEEIEEEEMKEIEEIKEKEANEEEMKV